MGNQQSQPPSQQLLKKNPHYGQNLVLSPQTQTIYKRYQIQTKSLDNFHKLLQKRKRLSQPNFVQPRSYFKKEVNQKKGIFGCQGDQIVMVYVQFSYYCRSLEDVIQEYCQRGVGFPEGQIIDIFVGILEVLVFLMRNGTCHGDMKPFNILLDPHSSAPKILDSYFLNGGKTAYQLVLENPSSMSFLSPQQLQKIKDRQSQSIEQIHKNEVFALGLTIMEAMTFQSAMQCYNLNKLCVKDGYFMRKYKELKSSGYSEGLVGFVLGCLRGERERLGLEECLAMLKRLRR